MWSQRTLAVRYRRGSGDHEVLVDRTLEPLGLVLKAGVWYLVAAVAGEGAAPGDGARATVRTYRLDRVAAAESTGATFTRPDGFDLAAHWAVSARRFEGSLLRASAHLRLSPQGLRRLPLVTDAEAAQRAIVDAQPCDDGWSLVTLEHEGDRVVIGQLLSLGPEVEVLEPETVRHALADLARRTAELNAP